MRRCVGMEAGDLENQTNPNEKYERYYEILFLVKNSIVERGILKIQYCFLSVT